MKINISQRSCFPAKNAREAIVLLNGYQADSIKTNPAIVVETFCISFWCICCFSYKIQMKREWEESSFHTVFCRTLSLIFSTKSLFGIGLENISILMLSVCKHEQYALMVTKSFGTTSMLYAHILRIHIFWPFLMTRGSRFPANFSTIAAQSLREVKWVLVAVIVRLAAKTWGVLFYSSQSYESQSDP